MDKALRVAVLTPLGQGGAGGIDRIMDFLRTEVSRQPHLRASFITTRGPEIWFSPLFTGIAALRLLWGGWLKRLDLVHINLSSNASNTRKAFLARCANAAGIPYVVHLHGGKFDVYVAGLTAQKRAATINFLEGAATIIVLGAYWRRFMEELAPRAHHRIVVLPNATPAFDFDRSEEPSRNKKRILFLGRLGQRKGSPDLVQALARLTGPQEWDAVLAGDGDLAETRRAVAEAGLADRVSIPGWVNPQQVVEELRAADILVLPSFHENQPMSVIEGFSAEVAVVATPVGATPDILRDGENGLFVEPGSVAQIADAIERLLRDPALRRRLASAGKAEHRARLEIGAYAVTLGKIWADAAASGRRQ